MSEFGKELCERARKHAVAVIRMSAHMPRNPAGWELARQVVRSSNSVAANLEEARGAISKPDFLNKVNLARKEARETHMWLRNIQDSGLLVGKVIEGLIAESDQLVGILVSSVKTLQARSAGQRSSGPSSKAQVIRES